MSSPISNTTSSATAVNQPSKAVDNVEQNQDCPNEIEKKDCEEDCECESPQAPHNGSGVDTSLKSRLVVGANVAAMMAVGLIMITPKP